MLFDCFNEMSERMCLGWDDSLNNQQTFESFFCGLLTVKAEVFVHDIRSALPQPGTSDITSCPD